MQDSTNTSYRSNLIYQITVPGITAVVYYSIAAVAAVRAGGLRVEQEFAGQNRFLFVPG